MPVRYQQHVSQSMPDSNMIESIIEGHSTNGYSEQLWKSSNIGLTLELPASYYLLHIFISIKPASVFLVVRIGLHFLAGLPSHASTFTKIAL